MQKGEHLVIPGSSPLEVGLSWDFFGDAIDLDATVVLINDVGSIADAVYYNQLVSKCGAISHSGDNQDGKKDGYDEVIRIDLQKVNHEINYLVVLLSSYQGVGFKNIETATVTIMQNSAKINEVFLGAVRSDVNNTVLAAVIYKKQGQWHIFNSQDQSPGKVFTECEEVIKSNLIKVGFDEVILIESKAWSAQNGMKFKLEKEKPILIPSHVSEITVGLGWDTKVDIDASVIMMSERGTLEDYVYFGQL